MRLTPSVTCFDDSVAPLIFLMSTSNRSGDLAHRQAVRTLALEGLGRRLHLALGLDETTGLRLTGVLV